MKVLIVSGIEGAPYLYRCLGLKEQFEMLGVERVECKMVSELLPKEDSREFDLFIMNRVYESLEIFETCQFSNSY